MNEIVTEHYKENYQRIVGYLRFRAGSEWNAEDVVQEAYYRALKYFPQVAPANFAGWFNRILHNSIKDFMSAERGHIADEFEEEYVEGNPCNRYNEKVIREIYELIDTKSLIQIEVLSMYFKLGYSPKDIAALTDITYGAAHQIIQRFRNELRDLYAE